MQKSVLFLAFVMFVFFHIFVSRVATLKIFILVKRNINNLGKTVAEAETGLEGGAEWSPKFVAILYDLFFAGSKGGMNPLALLDPLLDNSFCLSLE